MLVKERDYNNYCFKGIEAWNSRLFKDSSTNTYEIRFASILTDCETEENGFLQIKGSDQLNGATFVLTRGDFSPILRILNLYLTEARVNASNQTEKKMIAKYIKYFLSGNVNYHKDGSRYWVKDKGPVVETTIGFIETYRDPSGMRAEFEGMISLKTVKTF